MVKVDQASVVPAEASTKKVVDIKRFASPVKKAEQKTPDDSSSSPTKSAPSTRPSKVPESRQQEATNGANPSPSRIRESRRERTTLEAALDRIQAKRETATAAATKEEEEESSITNTEDEEQSTTSSSAMSDESSVMNALREAKARYDRMLTEKKRRKARQIKKLRSKNKKSSASTTPSSSPIASGASEDIFSLHSEFRVESVTASAAAVAAPTTVTSKKPSKKSKTAKAKKSQNDAIFREEAHIADDEKSVKVIQTGAGADAAEDMSSDDAVPAESLATSVYRLVATKSVDTEATPTSVGTKLEQYESKLHNLEKFLHNGGDSGAAAKSGEESKAIKADEDTPLEVDDLEVVEEEDEEEDEDEIADIEAMPTDDISYDEDTAARLLLGEDAEETRAEEQADNKATPSSGEREGAEVFSIPDCTNFCYWMFYGEDAPKGATKSLPEKEEAELSPEELVEKLARRMAMDAILPKKKVSRTKSLHSKPVTDDDDDVVTIYNRVDASAFVSRDVRMERAAR